MAESDWVDVESDWEDVPTSQVSKQPNANIEGLKAAYGAVTNPIVKSDNPILQSLASSLMPVKTVSTPKMGNVPSLTFPVPGYMAMGPLGQQSTAKTISQETSPLALAGTALGLMAPGGGTAQDINEGIDAFKLRSSQPPIIPPENEFAGNLVNSLIKPLHKQYSFGKNPGMGIAKEGIVGTSLNDLGQKVDSRLGELNQSIQEIRSSADNVDKVLDLSDTTKPLTDALTKLGKTPLTNSEEIKGINDAITDLGDLKGISLEKMNLNQAYEVKDIVKNMQKWNKESAGGTELNRALKEMYHNIDAKIDTAVPELAQLNERTANMISAKQAIAYRIEKLRNAEPLTWSKIADLPLKAFKSTVVKTGLARLLVDKYPALLGK